MSVKLISVSGLQTFNDGAKQKSQSSGKFEVLWNDADWTLTSDGGNFLKTFAFFTDTVVNFGNVNSSISITNVDTINITGSTLVQLQSGEVRLGNGIGTTELKWSLAGGLLPILKPAALAANRTWELPDASGIVALESGVNFGPAAPASITVVNGIVTAIA